LAVEGHRWAIEDSFETAKNEFGLDHNESRSWHGWHRHVSLVMLAFAMMAVIRHRAKPPPPPPKKTQRRTTAKTKIANPSLIRWSIQEVRRIAIRLAQKRIQPAHIIAWSLWRRSVANAMTSSGFGKAPSTHTFHGSTRSGRGAVGAGPNSGVACGHMGSAARFGSWPNGQRVGAAPKEPMPRTFSVSHRPEQSRA
jgi:hypothetical protein